MSDGHLGLSCGDAGRLLSHGLTHTYFKVQRLVIPSTGGYLRSGTVHIKIKTKHTLVFNTLFLPHERELLHEE